VVCKSGEPFPVPTSSASAPEPSTPLHELIRVRQRHLSRLSRPPNPNLDRPKFRVVVLLRVAGLVDVGPRRLDPARRVDGVLVIRGIGKGCLAVLGDPLTRSTRVVLSATYDIVRRLEE